MTVPSSIFLPHPPAPFPFFQKQNSQDLGFQMDDPTAGDDSTWHRVKWTDEMVRLLVAAVASVGDDPNPMARKGKWKAISVLMSQKSLTVSPQQCEDKFNDLNKRYKRLNEILGKGTTCDVVENPSLLDSMPQLSEKSKKVVRKILGSKQLFYREMCAYHNGYKIPNAENFELNGIGMVDGEESEDSEENGGEMMVRGSSDDLGWVRMRKIQLEEERLEIERERLDLKKQRMKWMRFRSKKEWEIERKELENERLLLENERMGIELKRRMVELGRKRPRDGGE